MKRITLTVAAILLAVGLCHAATESVATPATLKLISYLFDLHGKGRLTDDHLRKMIEGATARAPRLSNPIAHASEAGMRHHADRLDAYLELDELDRAAVVRALRRLLRKERARAGRKEEAR